MPEPRRADRPKARSVSPLSRIVTLLGGVGLLFLTLPIAALLLRALADAPLIGVSGAPIADALMLSAFTTAAAAGVTILFGTPLAYLFARRQFRFKHLLNVLIELPIVLPPAVAGLALLITFGRRGLLGPALEVLDITLPFSTAAVVMAQAFVAAPFYVRAAQIGFRGVPRETEEAARVDGAGGWRLFLSITLPLSRRALAAGLILSWARALGEFGATILFAGSLQGRTQTMPLLIYNVIERDLDAALWTGLILIALALVALLVAQRLSGDSADADETRGESTA
ncbi:MAG: ABC transporter permease [Anaerolineae bacterium]|nr:ABC transporter permease [Anaerolineae bacterium]NUQ05773.1 molybdate ABC transporter permease subunit [Anaerolineae bacterium]